MQIPEYENYHETKSHSTPDFPYNAYICSIPLDFEKVPLHWHDEVEIIYIKKGRGRVTLDFTSLYVEAGDIIIVSPGQLHAIGPAEDSMEYENIIFSLDLLCTGSMDALSSEFFEPFLAGTIGFEHLVCCDDEHYPALSSCLNHIDSISSSFPVRILINRRTFNRYSIRSRYQKLFGHYRLQIMSHFPLITSIALLSTGSTIRTKILTIRLL